MGLVFSLGAELGALFPDEPPELPADPKLGANLGKAHTEGMESVTSEHDTG